MEIAGRRLQAARRLAGYDNAEKAVQAINADRKNKELPPIIPSIYKRWEAEGIPNEFISYLARFFNSDSHWLNTGKISENCDLDVAEKLRNDPEAAGMIVGNTGPQLKLSSLGQKIAEILAGCERGETMHISEKPPARG